MDSGRFRTNSPPVIYETVDDEMIVVNLDTGSYYDLNETGGYILGLLERELTIGDLVQATAGRYRIETSVAERAVEELLARLLEEELVVAADGDGPRSDRLAPAEANGQPTEPHAAQAQPAEPRRFVAPILNKHTDMQELLLLDPVHEVDATGWPSGA